MIDKEIPELIYLDRSVKLYFILSGKKWGKYQNQNVACGYNMLPQTKCTQP